MRRFLRWIRSLIGHLESGEDGEEERNPPDDGTPPAHSSILDELLVLHQRESSLSRDTRLDSAAQVHVEYMAEQGALSHDRLVSRVRDAGIDYWLVAENVAMSNLDAESVFRLWMNSPGHRQNIVSRKYSRVGMALKAASPREVYWCVIFAS